MTGSISLLVGATLGVVLVLAPALALFFGGVPSRRDALVLVVAIPSSAAIAASEWMLLGTAPDVAFFQGALVSAAVAVILAVGLRVSPVRGLLVFVALWIVLVLVPVGYSVFDVVHGPLARALGTLDFGGVGVIGLSTGTAAVAFILMSRRRGNAVGGWPRSRPIVFVAVFAAAILGWSAVNAGSELVLDYTTAQLIFNEVVAALAGAVGWVAAQVVNVRRANMVAIVGGMIAGSVAILPASPWLDPPSIVVLGIGAAILGHVAAIAARRCGSGRWSSVLGVLLVPAMLGYISIGFVARGSGMIFSGHTDLLAGQFGGLVVVVGYSLVASVAIAFAVDRTLRLAGSSLRVDETLVRLYAAYNTRDTVRLLAALHPDVDWPNDRDGGRVHGRDALLEHWRQEWSEVNPVLTPVRSRRLRGALIGVSVHRVVFELDGSVQSDVHVTHTYRERDGVFDRMEVNPEGMP